jgi:hypothetical protein
MNTKGPHPLDILTKQLRETQISVYEPNRMATRLRLSLALTLCCSVG